MSKIYPTEKIRACAEEAIKLWEIAEQLNASAGEFIRKPSQENITAIQNSLSAFHFANPKKSFHYLHDIMYGQHSKNAERMRKYRERQARKAVEKADWTAAEAKPLWVEYPGGTRELFDANAEFIVAQMNSRQNYQPLDFIIPELIVKCQKNQTN